MGFVSCFLFIFAGLNAVAFYHAYWFMHRRGSAEATASPERLSRWARLAVLFTGIRLPLAPNKSAPTDIGHPFETEVVESPDGVGSPVWFIPAQESESLVIMLHGYAGRKEQLLPMADFWVRQGCDALLVDLPGHGDSPHNWTTLGVRETGLISHLVEVYRSRYPEKKLILYGISLGAVCLLRALHDSGLPADGVILEMPFASLLETVRERFRSMRFPVTFPFAESLVFWGGLQFGFNGFNIRPARDANRVSIPTLLVGGDQDPTVSESALHAIHDALRGPKTLKIFPNVKHEPLFDVARSGYEDLLLNFLSDVRKGIWNSGEKR